MFYCWHKSKKSKKGIKILRIFIADVISEFVNAYMKDEEQYDGCRECERTDDYSCIQCFRDRFLEELKE